MRAALTAIAFAVLATTGNLEPASAKGESDASDDPYIGGYIWHDDNWVPGIITIETWFTATPRYAKGNAVFYSPNVMEGTARWRGLSLDGYQDGVALMSPADIGATVWIRLPDGGWDGPFLVVDTAARHDMYPVVTHRNEIVEVGWTTAVRWGMVQRKPDGWYTEDYVIEDVEVLRAETLPSWAINLAGLGPMKLVDRSRVPTPIDYPKWYAEQVEFARGWEPHPYFVRPDQWDMRDGGPLKSWEDFDIEPYHYNDPPKLDNPG